MKPDAARFGCAIATFACSGVFAAWFVSIAPALPSSFKVPPAGRSAVKVKGKELVKEKSFTSIFTLSYTRGCCEVPARFTVIFPSFTLSLPTEKFGVLLPEPAGAGVVVVVGAEVAPCVAPDELVLLLPRLEKFHLSPF